MEFEKLKKIIKELRAKCPWDKKQTHASLRPYLIEEAYETLEAIDREDPEELREELGDLLLQIVFHATLAEEKGQFTPDDVVRGISEKMVSRHPHVFGDAHYETAEEVVGQWEERKKEEASPHVRPTSRFSNTGSLLFSRSFSCRRSTLKSFSLIRIFLMSG